MSAHGTTEKRVIVSATVAAHRRGLYDKKVAARVLVAPVFLSLNFGTLALLRGEDAVFALRQKVLPAWQTGTLFWPVVAALTYRYVPLLARPATGAAVGVVWSSFLSWVAHGGRGGSPVGECAPRSAAADPT